MNLQYHQGWRKCNPFGKWDAVSEDFLQSHPLFTDPWDEPATPDLCTCGEPLTEQELKDNQIA